MYGSDFLSGLSVASAYKYTEMIIICTWESDFKSEWLTQESRKKIYSKQFSEIFTVATVTVLWNLKIVGANFCSSSFSYSFLGDVIFCGFICIIKNVS